MRESLETNYVYHRDTNKIESIDRSAWNNKYSNIYDLSTHKSNVYFIGCDSISRAFHLFKGKDRIKLFNAIIRRKSGYKFYSLLNKIDIDKLPSKMKTKLRRRGYT